MTDAAAGGVTQTAPLVLAVGALDFALTLAFGSRPGLTVS